MPVGSAPFASALSGWAWTPLGLAGLGCAVVGALVLRAVVRGTGPAGLRVGRGLRVAGLIALLCLTVTVLDQRLATRAQGAGVVPDAELRAWLAAPQRAADPALTYLEAGSRSVSELGEALRAQPATRVVIGRIAFERLFDKPRKRALLPDWPESPLLLLTADLPGSAIAAAKAEQAARERLWRTHVGQTIRKHYERAFENESWLVLERRRAPDTGRATITLQPGVTHQRMLGWEATAGAEQDPAWGALRAEQFDALVDRLVQVAVEEVGINRLRVEVRANAEHSRDLWAEWQKSRDASFYRAHFYVSENDNDDPNLIDPAGFHFSELDNTVRKVVLPIKRALEARGEKLWINVEFIDWKKGPTNYHAESPAEYAEFVLATHLHLEREFGLRPDSWELVNEPDNPDAQPTRVHWTGERLGRAMVEARRVLARAGYQTSFVGPSTLKASMAVRYFEEMIAVPGARGLLGELSYHRYGDDGDAVLGQIGRLVKRHGLRSSMAERLGADYTVLHRDLKFARVSSWQLYALGAVTSDPQTRHGYVVIDPSRGPAGVAPSSRGKLLSQYFRHVRAGAQRFEARSRDVHVDPLAFRNVDGRVVVVAKVDRPRELAIVGLPAGRYGVSYGSDGEYQVQLPEQTLTAGQQLHTRMPVVGVLTVFGR